MAIEYLSSAADFAHMDGALVYPLFVDDYHVVVMEDGVTMLVLPAGIQVRFPGRFCIDVQNGMPYVDPKVSGKDAHQLAVWGQSLQTATLFDRIRASIAQVLAESQTPEIYVNPREEI